MEWLQWQDHVTEFEDRYTESKNDDGTITHKPVEGEVLQEGTPQNAQNFSNMQAWGIQGTEMAALALIGAMHNRQEAEDLAGDVMEVTLTNNETFPFNNSEKTVSLGRKRNHKIIRFLLMCWDILAAFLVKWSCLVNWKTALKSHLLAAPEA